MAQVYYSYRDHHTMLARTFKPAKMKPEEFYKQMSADVYLATVAGDADRTQFNHILSERVWWEEGRRYYNLHPRMVDILGGLNLPDIKASLIRFRDKACVVNFAEGDERFVIDAKHRLRSALCYLPTHVGELPTEEQVMSGRLKMVKPQHVNNKLVVWLDYDEQKDNRLLYTYKNLEWDQGDTLEQAYYKLADDKSASLGMKIPDELTLLATRLVLSVGFLAQEGNVLVQPHYLAEDLHRIDRADDKLRQELADKAERRRRMRGFVVGDDRFIPAGKRLGDLPSQPHDPTGRTLKYQHIVGVHWRTVHFGKNHSQSEARLILPYTRGKHLNFRPA